MDSPQNPAHLDLTYEEDLLVVRLAGHYDLEVELCVQRARDAIEATYGYRLILLDARKIGTVTPEARKTMVTWSRGRKAPSAIAMFGANFSGMTLAKMVLSAVRVLSKRPMRFEFFETEAAARAWLGERREDLRKLVP
ncbi:MULTISPECIES: hypothetical protein [Polyangium]|uniref:STAS/SEC14 domain-containing protein n=2 Tax=Polyangium TaxID=55 RepID=A0A4U1JIZ2_9BACT|nr:MULTISPECIES: hypothetical protein [Polyangium]MDI1437261.1 hypothetical protein [Polyangium sorediatum]TKD12671.1 hypothetical protein E8A74_02660 [Polyangium fumosum]